MNTYTFRTNDILKVDDGYNKEWNYRYLRYYLHDETQVTVPYGSNIRPMVEKYKNGNLISFDDVFSIQIL